MVFTMGSNGVCNDRDIGNLIDQGMRPKLILFNYIGENYFTPSNISSFDFGLYNCTLKDDGGYPVGNGNYLITTDNNNIRLSNASSIHNIDIDYEIPSGTFINCLISFDKRNSWLKWDGSSWNIHTGGISNLATGNTIPEMLDGLANFTLNEQSHLDFAFELGSTDGVNSPSVTSLSANLMKKVQIGYFFEATSLYAMGGLGATTDCLENAQSTDTWVTKTAFPESVDSDYIQGFSLSEKGYRLGGYRSSGDMRKQCHEYVPDIWTQKTDMPFGAAQGGACQMNGKGYIVSGITSSGHNDNYCAEYSNDIWVQLPTLSIIAKEYCHNMFAIDSSFYAIGWISHRSSNCRFDGANWILQAELSPARSQLGAASLDNKGYAVGGDSGQFSLDSVTEYTPDTWVGKAHSTQQGNAMDGVTTLDNKLHRLGGYKRNTGNLELYEEYSADTWVSKQSLPSSRFIALALAL